MEQQKDAESQSLLQSATANKRICHSWSLVVQLVALGACCAALGGLLWSLNAKIQTLQQALPASDSLQPFKVDESRLPCSGNGIQSQADLVCTCYDCWTGPDCSIQQNIQMCVVDVNSGSPLLFEDYWIAHPEGEVKVPASYNEGYGWQLPQLEKAIRALHAQVGNAVTDGRQIVIGMGSGQVLDAAFYAFANASRSPGANITKTCAEVPYYNAYKDKSEYFASSLFEWSETTKLEASSAAPVIQVMTSPNNPDGSMRNKTISGAFGVYDHAYYWPHFAPISKPVEYGSQDVAVFTLSKLTGHAGSRIGWGIVQDPAVAQLMMDHISQASGRVQENQLRATHLLQHVLADQGGLSAYARGHMEHRWDVLQKITAKSSRLSIQDLEPAQYDTWTGTVRSPSPAYAWLHCNEPRDADCYQAMYDTGIIGRPGPFFGADTSYNRLELLMQPPVFDTLAAKLEMFVMG